MSTTALLNSGMQLDVRPVLISLMVPVNMVNMSFITIVIIIDKYALIIEMNKDAFQQSTKA